MNTGPRTEEIQFDEKWDFVRKKQKNCDDDLPSRRSVLPHRFIDPLPLGAGVMERNNVERVIEGEADCGPAARWRRDA